MFPFRASAYVSELEGITVAFLWMRLLHRLETVMYCIVRNMYMDTWDAVALCKKKAKYNTTESWGNAPWSWVFTSIL